MGLDGRWIVSVTMACVLPLAAGAASGAEVGSGNTDYCPALVVADSLGYRNATEVRDVRVSGKTVYTADVYGLGIWDVSDEAHRVHLGHWAAPQPGEAVALAGNELALLADGESGLFFVDVSDPFRPHRLGVFDGMNSAVDVAVSGNTAYVVDARTGLRILNILDPSNPLEIGVFETGTTTYAVAVSGTAAYLLNDASSVNGDTFFEVIDISDPRAPSLLGSAPFAGSDISIGGDTAYVAQPYVGLGLISISDPAHPVLLGLADTPSSACGVAVSGTTAYVTDCSYYGGASLDLLDVSDPASPSKLGSLDLPGNGWRVAAAGNTALVADGTGGLQIVDVSHPSTPIFPGGPDPAGFAHKVRIVGTLAYVADLGGGLRIVDIGDAWKPVVLGKLETSGSIWSVAVAGNTAYLADYSGSLQVVDVSDPRHPSLLGSCPVSGSPTDVGVEGDLAYLSRELGGLQIVDVSDPRHPVLLGHYDDDMDNFYALDVVGNRVYLLGASVEGLLVLDVSDPNNPRLVGSYAPGGFAMDVAVDGAVAYVALEGSRGGSLVAVDVSDPARPTVKGGFGTPSRAVGVRIAGGVALVAELCGGIEIVDVSNLSSGMRLLGALQVPGTAWDVAAAAKGYVVAAGPFLDFVTVACRAPEAHFVTALWGLDMEFHDRSLYAPTTWSWDFGDGSISEEKDPRHRYPRPGIYDVTLRAGNGHGSSRVTVQVRPGLSPSARRPKGRLIGNRAR